MLGPAERRRPQARRSCCERLQYLRLVDVFEGGRGVARVRRLTQTLARSIGARGAGAPADESPHLAPHHADIRRVLEDEKGNVEKTAARLEVPKSSLYEKIRRHGIVVSKV